MMTMALSSWQRPVPQRDGRGIGTLLIRRLMLFLLPLALAASPAMAAPPPSDSAAQATAFMNELWNHALELLNNKTPTRSKTSPVSRIVP